MPRETGIIPRIHNGETKSTHRGLLTCLQSRRNWLLGVGKNMDCEKKRWLGLKGAFAKMAMLEIKMLSI
jgi:hypothetical protein